MRHKYTEKQLNFIRTKCRTISVPDLMDAFNQKFGMAVTESAIRSAMKNHKIRSGRPKGNPKGTFRIFSKAQARFIERKYAKMPADSLCEAFNREYADTPRTIRQIRSFVHNHRINCGRTGRFERGHRTWNAGTKGLTGKNKTTFKKGNRPANTRPMGAQRLDTKDGYLLVKINERNPYTGAPTRFKAKHVALWEKRNDPVPPGHAVIFRDGDKRNFRAGNLILVSRAELLHLNRRGYAQEPDELKPSILSLSKLEVKLFALQRKT